jgi:hypothetical protein
MAENNFIFLYQGVMASPFIGLDIAHIAILLVLF